MTVDELKQRMSAAEFASWLRYADEMGPLNPMLRVDAAVARAVAPFVTGDKSLLMPYPKEPERVATVDDFMKILKVAKKPEAK